MSRYLLEAQQLAKRYPKAGDDGGDLTIFENVSFGIAPGEFVCTIGHSGCGKSTILNIIAGLDTATEGVVIMDGKEVTRPHLDRGVVFQNHSLLPWLTALENIQFAVRARWPGWSRAKISEHAMRYVEMVGLKGAEQRRPSQLSGGMRQRVGIARAFAIQPKLLLLDEPFGALDALTRGTIQDELVHICAETKQTVFMITHDIDEAILLSNRIFLMTNGPRARIAEAVNISIPAPRVRAELVHQTAYYPIRNHLVDFFVSRSKARATVALPGTGLHYPPEVDPAAEVNRVSAMPQALVG